MGFFHKQKKEEWDISGIMNAKKLQQDFDEKWNTDDTCDDNILTLPSHLSSDEICKQAETNINNNKLILDDDFDVFADSNLDQYFPSNIDLDNEEEIIKNVTEENLDLNEENIKEFGLKNSKINNQKCKDNINTKILDKSNNDASKVANNNSNEGITKKEILDGMFIGDIKKTTTKEPLDLNKLFANDNKTPTPTQQSKPTDLVQNIFGKTTTQVANKQISRDDMKNIFNHEKEKPKELVSSENLLKTISGK